MRPGTGDGLAACTGGGLAACTSSTCSKNCLVSSCRFSLMKSRGKFNEDRLTPLRADLQKGAGGGRPDFPEALRRFDTLMKCILSLLLRTHALVSLTFSIALSFSF